MQGRCLRRARSSGRSVVACARRAQIIVVTAVLDSGYTGTSVATLQWAVTGYSLVGAAVIVTSGSLGDVIGRKRVFQLGLLLFVAWQANPLTGFVPVQRKLDSGDALSRFLRHEASGLFAVPGGPAKGEYVGQRLLEG